METYKLPLWYPNRAKLCMKSFSFLENIPNDGIVFIKYPKNLHEEYMPILKGLFQGNGKHFVNYEDTEFELVEVNNDLYNFINKKPLKAGPMDFTFHIEDSELILLRGNKKVNVENPSHQTLMQCIRAINLILQANSKVVCLQMNAGSLDDNSLIFIYELFEFVYNKIKNNDKDFIVYFSDDSKFTFCERYLWRKTCCKYFAVITGKITYRVPDAEKAIKNIKESLKKMDYKRIDLFVGAGAGVPSGLPSGEALKLKALKELTGNYDEDDPEGLLKKVFDKYPSGLPGEKDKINFEMLMTLLQKESHDDLFETEVLKDFIEKHKNARKNPSEGYKTIRKIVEENKVLVLAVTTNFDRLLEDSIPDATTTVSEEKFKSMDSKKIVKGEEGNNIVKLHGCLDYPNTLIIKNEYLIRLDEYKRSFMKTFLTEGRDSESIANVFFIGYNFADPDILNVLTENIDTVRIRPLVVNPELSPTIMDFMGKYDKVGKASLIPFGFDFLMETVKELINKHTAST